MTAEHQNRRRPKPKPKQFDPPHLQELRIPQCDSTTCTRPAERALVVDSHAEGLYCTEHAQQALIWYKERP